MPETIYPDKDSIIEYGKKTAAKFYSLVTITGFADFESKLKPMSHNSTEKNPNIFENILNSESYTIKCENYELVSYSVIFVDSYQVTHILHHSLLNCSHFPPIRHFPPFRHPQMIQFQTHPMGCKWGMGYLCLCIQL